MDVEPILPLRDCIRRFMAYNVHQMSGKQSVGTKSEPEFSPPGRKMSGRAKTAWQQLVGHVIDEGGDPARALVELELAADCLAQYRREQAARPPDKEDLRKLRTEIRQLRAQIFRLAGPKSEPEPEKPANPFDEVVDS